MINNIEFVKKHYPEQIDAFNGFIEAAYPYLPDRDNSYVRFGGGTALAIYYYQHRLSFDIDLFVTDPQVINYLSPKHWLDESNFFNQDKYIDLANHIRVLHKKNNVKVDLLVSSDNLGKAYIDDSKKLFTETVYVESIEDIIAKKIVYRRNDNLTRDIIDIGVTVDKEKDFLKRLLQNGNITMRDLKDLYHSLNHLDTKTFNEEIEVIGPFDDYLETSKSAPKIIKNSIKEILKP